MVRRHKTDYEVLVRPSVCIAAKAATHVRYGSGADIARHQANVRFSPESGHPICTLMDKSAGLFQPRRGPASLARLRPPRPASGEHRSILAVLGFPLLGAHRLVRNGINDVAVVLRSLVEHSEVLTQDHKGSLLCILMRTAPLEPCDTAAIAAAVSSSSLSVGTCKTALTITLTRWPFSSSSRTWTLGPHVTALPMLEKAIAFNSRKTCSRLTSARSAARPTIS